MSCSAVGEASGALVLTGSQVARARLPYVPNGSGRRASSVYFGSGCQKKRLAGRHCCLRTTLVRAHQSPETRVVAQSPIQLRPDRSVPRSLPVLETLAQSTRSRAAS